jgi:hypothetical protein
VAEIMRLQSDRQKLRRFASENFLTKPSLYKSNQPVPVRVQTSISRGSTGSKGAVVKNKKRKVTSTASQEGTGGEYIEKDDDTLDNNMKKMKIDVKEPNETAIKSTGEAKVEAVTVILPSEESGDSQSGKLKQKTELLFELEEKEEHKDVSTVSAAEVSAETWLASINLLTDQLHSLPSSDVMATARGGIVCLDVEVVTDGSYSQFSQIGAVLSIRGRCFSFGAQVGQKNLFLFMYSKNFQQGCFPFYRYYYKYFLDK